MSSEQKAEYKIIHIVIFYILSVVTYLLIFVLRVFFEKVITHEAIYNAIANFIIILPGTIFFIKKYRLKFSNLKTTQNVFELAIIYGITLTAISYFGIPPGKPQGFYNVQVLLPEDGVLYIMLYLVIQIIAVPVTEEIVYRFSIYNIIKNKLNIFCGYFITSLIFAIEHSISNYYIIVIAFVLSAILIHLYEKTKNIMASIIAHSFVNLLIIMFSYSDYYF